MPIKTLPEDSPIETVFEITDEGLLIVTVTEPQSRENLEVKIDTTEAATPEERRAQERRCSELTLE